MFNKFLQIWAGIIISIVLCSAMCLGTYVEYNRAEIAKIKVMQEKKRIENETLKLQIEAQKVACDCITQQQYIQSREGGI